MTIFDRRAHPVARAPGPDQEVERDQHQVEEGDEQDQILARNAPSTALSAKPNQK